MATELLPKYRVKRDIYDGKRQIFARSGELVEELPVHSTAPQALVRQHMSTMTIQLRNGTGGLLWAFRHEVSLEPAASA